MSYRDQRNFTEMMRVLGYPRLLSFYNLQYPNFPLVAEILIWIVKRFDNDADVWGDHTEEPSRIALIRQAAEFMVKHVNVKLDTRKLYMADINALPELLKMTSLLYEAQFQKTTDLLADNEPDINFDISERLNDLKNTKQLASQLTINGAILYDLLGREVELRGIRNYKLSSQYDSADVEVAIKEIIESTRGEIEETKNQIENIKNNCQD